MSRAERKHVQAIRDAADALLAARGYAETYMARVAFVRTCELLKEWAVSEASK